MQAGKPLEDNDYIKQEVEGIPFYIHRDLADGAYQVNWAGFWVFGRLVADEIKAG